MSSRPEETKRWIESVFPDPEVREFYLRVAQGQSSESVPREKKIPSVKDLLFDNQREESRRKGDNRIALPSFLTNFSKRTT